MITTAIVEGNFLNLANAQKTYSLIKATTKIVSFENNQVTLYDDTDQQHYYIPIADFKSNIVEVASEGSVELTGGISGSVDGITVDGVEVLPGAPDPIAFDTSLDNTASLIAAAITANPDVPYTASSVGAVITITYTGKNNEDANTFAVVSTATTITTTDTAFANGVTALLLTEGAIRTYLSDKIGA